MQGRLGFAQAQNGHDVQHCLCSQLVDLHNLCIGRLAQAKEKLGQRSSHYPSQEVVAGQQQSPTSKGWLKKMICQWQIGLHSVSNNVPRSCRHALPLVIQGASQFQVLQAGPGRAHVRWGQTCNAAGVSTGKRRPAAEVRLLRPCCNNMGNSVHTCRSRGVSLIPARSGGDPPDVGCIW